MPGPNVILVLTDDQGFADLGCSGNPWLKTPHLDAFHDAAVRFTDFHVQPLCTPTRGALMTGRRPLRNGAWATCWGRSILRREETVLPQLFAAAGYRTGMFGKWHLGDNYPYRPFDRGFQQVVAHKGGGVGQTPDFWGNDYFDDTYFHNGRPAPRPGYCTDVWFKEAEKFISSCGREPFFVYLATNAPHSPYLVADRYADPYRGKPEIVEPEFYGMIANLDENFGGLRRFLADRGLEENTLLIFMTDNGSSGGCRTGREGFVTAGYNAGLRGQKGSYYDGGHRVPCFMRWPAGGLTGGRGIPELALDIDLLPTLAGLCGLAVPSELRLDGLSLAPLLRGQAARLPEDRIHFLQYRQSTAPPEQWENAVLTRRWRLIWGRELYDLPADPGQRRDVAAEHPEVVARLRAAHQAWWAEAQPDLDAYSPLVLGHEAENPSRLDAMDVMGDVAWHQAHILAAMKSSGRWSVETARTGRYRFGLRRWPRELGLPINDPAPIEQAEHLLEICQGRRYGLESRSIAPSQARLKIFDREELRPVAPREQEVVFELDLDRAGATTLEAWFRDADCQERGAYYVYVERMA